MLCGAANDKNTPFAADNLTLHANFLYRRAYFHILFVLLNNFFLLGAPLSESGRDFRNSRGQKANGFAFCGYYEHAARRAQYYTPGQRIAEYGHTIRGVWCRPLGEENYDRRAIISCEEQSFLLFHHTAKLQS